MAQQEHIRAMMLGAASLASIPSAMAQSSYGNNLRDRTGPQVEVETPAFREAPNPLYSVPEKPPLPAAIGTALVTSIEVIPTSSEVARALRQWMPSKDPTTGLELTQSEVLDETWVSAQFYHNGLVGQPAPLNRLVSLIQQINRAFIANGYINSGILLTGEPPTNGGVLKLRLILGRAGTDGKAGFVVAWADRHNRGLRESFVRDRMPAAARAPLNAANLERQFRQLTEHPAIKTVDANLQPGTRPGEASLTLTVEPADRFDFYLSFANNRSPSIGGERHAVGASLRNLVGSGDLISVEGGLTGKRGDVLGSYDAPIFDPNTSIIIRGGYNEAAVTDPQLQPLGISAKDWHFETGLARNMVQRPLLPNIVQGRWEAAHLLTLGVRVAFRESRTYLFNEPFSFGAGSVDGRSRYSAIRLTADWVERGVNMVFAVSLTGTQGISGTRSSIPGVLSPDLDFRSVRLQASLARRLGSEGLELRARLGGQWSDGVLYSGERFSAGGAQSVRGFRETLLLADTGANGTVEFAHPVNLASTRKSFNWGAFVLSAFIDGALLHNRRGPQPSPDMIASVGASVSWAPSPAITTRLSYGYALTDVALAGRRDIQDRGFHFQITVRPLKF